MTTTIQQSRPRAQALREQMGPAIYRAAYQAGMSLSAWLESQDPSSEYRDGLDAFERQCMLAGVRTRSHPALGIYANEFGAFLRDEQTRALVPEWAARIWREVQHGRSASTRALYTSGDEIPGSSMRPYAEAAALRVTSPVAPPIALSDIVAITTPIDGNTYRSVYLTTSTTDLRMRRVAESADIPLFKLTTSQNSINLYKYGTGVESTYESLRRARLDKVRFWLQQMALQAEMDRVSEAINILVSGDGNSGTAATNWRAKTDFDSTATGKTITLKAYLNYKLKFFPLYRLSHIFGTEADILKLLLLNVGDSDQMAYLGDPTAAPGYDNMLRDGVRYGITADVPADKLVGLDARSALERVIEIGSNIQEIERFARNQTQVLTMTEVEAFAILQPGTVKTLELET